MFLQYLLILYRLAKTVYWGQSLMDAGVGSFVFSAGMFSQEARKGIQNSRLTKAIMECVPMVILGLIRIWLVKSTGYNEEVIEYGVYWNFFFTLAFCKVILLSLSCFTDLTIISSLVDGLDISEGE